MKASAPPSHQKALACAVRAAQQAGKLMRRNQGLEKKINARTRHDIKLDLDVRCQKVIEKILLDSFPASGLLGEEGLAGASDPEFVWVVDPIDGTVNFTYGIPHACVSIALQQRVAGSKEYATVAGVVYDPFCDELWTAIRGGPARLNGKIIHVSRRTQLNQTILAMGFAKGVQSLRKNLPVFNLLVRRVLKIRMMGSATLALVYVASGRFDAFLESGISIWDIAAGGLIVECAGGEFWRRPIPGYHKYQLLATNGLLRQKIERIAREAHRSPPNRG